MAKTQLAEQKTTLASWQDVDQSLRQIAIRRNELNRIDSEMNEQILKIQNKYNPEVSALGAEIIGYEKNIELFCKSHKADFGDKKSKELNFGIVAFRLGTGKLATLKGFTWESVKKLIQSTKKYKDLFIKTTTSINKDNIIASGLKDTELAKIGCYIDQSESFSYEAYLQESKEVA